VEHEVKNLSDLGKLFFEINKTDSALFYIDLSNILAEKNNFLNYMAESYLALSEFEESRGNIKSAFGHYKKYANLKEEVFNTNIFGDINQLQYSFEVSKTNQQIEQLVLEQYIKERTIRYQKKIQWISWAVLLLISVVLLFIYYQNRRLNTAYKTLFEKNLEITRIQKSSSEFGNGKNKKTTLANNIQDELLPKILAIMENTEIICDPDFVKCLKKLPVLVRISIYNLSKNCTIPDFNLYF
jgi:hypothetical protein